jgi:hypothetical protein
VEYSPAQLLDRFEATSSYHLRLKLKRAALSKANKAKARGDVKTEEEYRRILAEMQLGGKVSPRSAIALKAWQARRRSKTGHQVPSQMTPSEIENELYQRAKEQTQKALASGKSKEEVKEQISNARLQLQLTSMYSTVGGFGGAPNYERIQSAIRSLDRVEAELEGGKTSKKASPMTRRISHARYKASEKHLTIPLEKVSTKAFLIIPHGPSRKGEDWRKGVMQVTSLSAVDRSIGLLKKRGWDSGRILAPMAHQEGRETGFIVIGEWGTVDE